jgi:DNA-binding NarL/FixJ family response regulator
MFTPTELKIYNLVVEGKRNKEIGQELGISERTVETHMRNILVKIRCRNRIELIIKELRK